MKATPAASSNVLGKQEPAINLQGERSTKKKDVSLSNKSGRITKMTTTTIESNVKKTAATKASALVVRKGTLPTRASSSDPLEMYMAEVNRHAVLPSEEQIELARAYVKTQDPAHAARLVTTNLRLVVKIARELHRGQGALLDLIQEGNLGLMHAIRKFDPERGVKVSSYASWWIRAYIFKSIMRNARLVRLGTSQTQRKLFFRLRREMRKRDAMGIEIVAEDLAKELGVDANEVVDMMGRLAAAEISLDAPIHADGNSGSLIDTLSAPPVEPGDQIDIAARNEQLNDKLEAFLHTLSTREQVVFNERIVSEEPQTLQDLGERFQVSRERIRQIEKAVQSKLAKYLKGKISDELLVAA